MNLTYSYCDESERFMKLTRLKWQQHPSNQIKFTQSKTVSTYWKAMYVTIAIPRKTEEIPHPVYVISTNICSFTVSTADLDKS